MRAIFVNYVHPEESHIAGVRLKAFADVFANNGHQIILITRTKEDKAEVNISPGNLAQSLRAHDWKAPYHLAIQPENNYWLEGVRNDTLFPLFRKTVVLYAYIFKRGMLAGWVDACRVYYEVLAREFKPQITWGTFGGVDSWEISQKIASQADCPWVMDVKDPWSVFVPRPLQRFLAARYKDASYMTANSLGQAKEAWKWLPKNYTAIYSGFSESALSHVIPNLKNDEFRITFFGSYNEVKLAEFLFALDGWYSSQDKDRKIILSYAGLNQLKFEALATKILHNSIEIITFPYLDKKDLGKLCRSSHVNAYIRSPSVIIHHKCIELLSYGRPIIAFPGETEEVIRIIQKAGGVLITCTNDNELRKSFSDIADNKYCVTNLFNEALKTLTWEHQGHLLEKIFYSVVRHCC